MANDCRVAGVHSYAIYGKETTYGSAVTPTTHFGLNSNFNPSISRNLLERRGSVSSATGGRAPLAFLPTEINTKFSIDFDVLDFAFMEFVLGSVTGTTTKTYSISSDTISFTLANNIINNSTNREDLYAGCVVDSLTIRGAMNEPISATLNCIAATVTNSSTVATNVAYSGTVPYTFIGATFGLPNTTYIENLVESFEITIPNNYKMLYGASVYPVSAVPTETSYQIKLNTKYKSSDLLQKILGSTTYQNYPTLSANLKINLSRTGASSVLEFDNVSYNNKNDTYSLNQPIGEDVDLLAYSFTVAETTS